MENEAGGDNTLMGRESGDGSRKLMGSEGFGSEPENFEQAFGMGESEKGNAQREIGGAAISSAASSVMNSEGMRSIETELAELGANGNEGSDETIGFSGIDMETGMKETPEIRPLAADGSTERRLGKSALLMSDKDIDLEIVKEVERSKEESKDNFKELSAKRDEMMVKFMRDKFGLIFGDDGNETEAGEQNMMKKGGSEAA